MTRMICCIAAIGMLGIIGVGTATANDGVKAVTISSATGKTRCPQCDGTGFGPNAKGEKGKGKYNCSRCKGTGRV